MENGVHIWKYTSGRYTLWRDFSQNSVPIYNSPLHFSPTLSSLLGCYTGVLHLWRLDDLPIVVHPDRREQLVAPSRCGSYIATGRKGDSTVTITNLRSQTSSHIDAGVVIKALTLTRNVLLVQDSETIIAWRLTEEGIVDGVFADGRAGRSNSIWAIPLSGHPMFLVEDQAAVIQVEGNTVHTYHPGTGEVLEPAPTIQYPRQDSPRGIVRVGHYPHERGLSVWGTPSERDRQVLWTVPQEGWVKDPEGKRRIWLPVEWRGPCFGEGWSCNSEALWLGLRDRTVIIKF